MSDLTTQDFMFGAWQTLDDFGPAPEAGVLPIPVTDVTLDIGDLDNIGNASERILGNGAANTSVEAKDGNDYITTDGWNISVFAGRGNDIIELDGTNNSVVGGPGYDYYIFNGSTLSYSTWEETWATLGDYQDGFDKIVIESGTGGVTSFADVQNLLVQDGNNVKIAFADLPDIIIENTDLANLDASDFIFTPDPASTSAIAATSLSVTAASSTTPQPAAALEQAVSSGSTQVNGFARWFRLDSLAEFKADMRNHAWFNDATISPLPSPAKVPASNLEVLRSASRFNEAIASFAVGQGLGDLLSHKEWQASNDHFFAARRL